MGLKRNLTAAEIVEQAVFARRLLSSEVDNITNVVFMVSVSSEAVVSIRNFTWSSMGASCPSKFLLLEVSIQCYKQ